MWEGTKADVGVQWLQRARCRVGRVLDTSNFLPLSPSLVGVAGAVKRLEIQGPSARAYDSGWKHHDGGTQWQQVPGLANGHGRFACPLKLHTAAALAERADNLHPSHPIRQVKDSSATLELLGTWSYFLSCHSLEVHHDDSRRRHSLPRPRENDCSIASSHGRATGCNDSVTHRVRSCWSSFSD